MTAEQSFFLTLLADFINSRQSYIPDSNINFEQLAKYASIHQVEGIVFYQCGTDAAKIMQSSFASNTYNAVNRNYLLKKIDTEFSNADIPYLIFKGTEVAKYYPVETLRTMGDSDILVHPGDKEKAHEILLAIGFENHVKEENEWIYSCRNLEFELHSRLMNDELVSLPCHNDFMGKVWDNAFTDDGIRYYLDWNYHFAFLMLHLRKHLINSGIGFRQFMDIAIVAKNCNIDWEKEKKLFEQLQISEFAATCFSFIERWFDVHIPFDKTIIEDTFFNFATESVFAAGVFGFDDSDNEINYTIVQMQKANSVTGEKVRQATTFLFPSYSVLVKSRKYSYLNGRPYLLPYVWVVRMIKSVFNGTSGMRKDRIARVASVSKEQIAIRENYLKQWGL